MTQDNLASATTLPAVRIVRGHPDDVELAALVAGLAATVQDEEEPPAHGYNAWTDRSRLLRGAPTTRGDDAWRWSLRR